jgi:hypothetical protein
MMAAAVTRPAMVGVTTTADTYSATATRIISSRTVMPAPSASVQSMRPSNAATIPRSAVVMSATTRTSVATRPRNFPTMNSQRATGFERML